MPILKEKPTLLDIQKYVKEIETERGFTDVSIIQNCLLLGEEVGELFKAVRKTEKMKTDLNSNFTSVEEELADIIIFISSIANQYNIDLETAFRNKEEINKKREWK
ncbi:MAG: MazG nucleotide pyrophosphohydrolase domain-containing protein [Patescibacteria group bacterium]|jgi:NTP pyrophosphatase (non-canonical NTP hydrolase)